MKKLKVGDKVRVRFKRGDGSYYRSTGTIKRIWGKKPYAATVVDKGGPIRVGIGELTKVKK